jgi:hypothetical protein
VDSRKRADRLVVVPTVAEKPQPLRALHTLLSAAVGADADLARQVQAAVDFTLENAAPGGPDAATLGQAAEALLGLFRRDGRTPALAHLDLREQAWEPLWIRQRVLAALRPLAGCREGILLTTGLRRLACPPGRRWTVRARGRYQDAIEYIQEAAAAQTSAKTVLHLLFI